jgi:uncharacterized protein YjiS (DUF1127 family)
MHQGELVMHGEIYGKSTMVQQHPRTLGTAVEDAVIRLFDELLGWHERARSRRMLAELDDRMLHDIGINRADVSSEVSRPFWR